MRARTVVLAGALVLTPLGAKATDLVVWWQKGFYSQEDAAVQEIVAPFEQGSRKQVELVIALLRERLRVLELITLVRCRPATTSRARRSPAPLPMPSPPSP